MWKSNNLRPCRVWATKLALTHPEDLSPGEQAKLLAHLDKCAACSAIRLEYHLMDMRISNYPPFEKLHQLSAAQPIPEYETHRLGLLVQREEKRKHGITLMVSGGAFLFLALACLMPLLFSVKTGTSMVTIDVVGIVVPMYFLWNGVASVFSSLRPVTIEEVKQRRNDVRRNSYDQAHGKHSPEYTIRGRKKTLLMGSGLTIAGGWLLLYALKPIPQLPWVYVVLIGGIVCFIESVLLLEPLYLAPRREKERPAQCAQELSRLLTDGELITVQKIWGQTFEEESEL
jgi:hypothetical protein